MEALRAGKSCSSHHFSALLGFPDRRLLRHNRYLPHRTSSFQKSSSFCTAQLPPPLSAVLATAAHACDRRLELGFAVGSEVVPHPAKMEKGGEDAFFVSSYNGGVLGVADGVSGWAEENVDPALFARELMEHAAAAVGNEEVKNCPRQLIAKAHEATSTIGAATVIVAILERKDGILHIANVGDCGLRLVRKGKIVFATSTQQHYFDCPYQLSSEAGAQTSEDAMVYNIEVMEGDTIIMGSDGLFDNVYDNDIETTIGIFGGSDKDSAQRTASALALLASQHAKDVKYESPYSQEAILQGNDLPFWKKILGQKLTGGKLDDITVLIAHVVDADTLPKDETQSSKHEMDAATLLEDVTQSSKHAVDAETLISNEAESLKTEHNFSVQEEENGLKSLPEEQIAP